MAAEKERFTRLPPTATDAQRQLRSRAERAVMGGSADTTPLTAIFRNDWGNVGTLKATIMRDAAVLRRLADTLERIYEPRLDGSALSECNSAR